jgi:hypothetical protein
MTDILASDSSKELESPPMKTAPTFETEVKCRRWFLAGTSRVLWNAVRLPIAAVLLLLEPVVSFICGLGLVLGVLTSFLFEFSVVGPRFPFVKAIAISLGFGVVLFFYYGLLSIFVED